MSEPSIVALINGAVAIILLVLGARLSGKVNKIRDQVVNGHDTNLREEADERHSENSTKLDRIEQLLHRVEGSVTRLWEFRAEDSNRLHELELTQPRKPPTRKRKE